MSGAPVPTAGSQGAAAPSIGVALSGGGHRAALFALAVLTYLVDAGKARDVVSIASVSGGSLTNGYVAQSLDLRSTTPAAFREAIGPLGRRLAHTGTLLPPSPFTWLYLIATVLAVACLVAVWFLPIVLAGRWIGFAVLLIVVALLIQARGLVCARAFARTLYSPTGAPTKLAQCYHELDHVICATELHAGENVYFAPRFVCSYRLGLGTPGDLDLHVAVQCSAALPGAFPPRWLPTDRHGFSAGRDDGATASRMALVDGGVYDNMADQWALGIRARLRRWPTLQARIPDEEIIVNASASVGWTPLRRMRIPMIGEIAALLRDKTILYDNGNAVRRELAVERFRGMNADGALVHIAQSPLRVADRYASSSDPDLAERAAEVISLLGAHREDWAADAAADATMGTTLWGFRANDAERLFRHGYVLAMANLHVLLGHPLLEVPTPEDIAQLLRGAPTATGG